jgi:N4-(beta-N-acetylglucosaminyl)-L-asparaginase
MFSRRNFIGTASFGAFLAACQQTLKKDSLKNAHSKAGFPLAIATWEPNVKAVAAAAEILKKGGSSLDAVEAAARVPEADPNDTSVGYGGLPDRDGHVTLDACIMDSKGRAGSVTFVQNIMHVVSLARAVMEKTPHVIMSGAGAEQFAVENGFKRENLLIESSKKKWQEWLKTAEYKPKINVERHDTIGVLAIDAKGDASGACTTSGLAYKMHGRVGDSPIIGAGLFVDNEIGATVATGLGETVLRNLSAFLTVELMRQGHSPQSACEEAIGRLVKNNPNVNDYQVGIIAVNKAGEHGAFAVQKGFNYVLYQGDKTAVFESENWLDKQKK